MGNGDDLQHIDAMITFRYAVEGAAYARTARGWKCPEQPWRRTIADSAPRARGTPHRAFVEPLPIVVANLRSTDMGSEH
jgi:hypothetical protein